MIQSINKYFLIFFVLLTVNAYTQVEMNVKFKGYRSKNRLQGFLFKLKNNSEDTLYCKSNHGRYNVFWHSFDIKKKYYQVKDDTIFFNLLFENVRDTIDSTKVGCRKNQKTTIYMTILNVFKIPPKKSKKIIIYPVGMKANELQKYDVKLYYEARKESEIDNPSGKNIIFKYP